MQQRVRAGRVGAHCGLYIALNKTRPPAGINQERFKFDRGSMIIAICTLGSNYIVSRSAHATQIASNLPNCRGEALYAQKARHLAEHERTLKEFIMPNLG